MERVQTLSIGETTLIGRPSVILGLRKPAAIGRLMRSYVVILQDARSGENLGVLWGREVLQEIADSGRDKDLVILMIRVLPEMDETAAALAACMVAKRSNDFAMTQMNWRLDRNNDATVTAEKYTG